MEIEVIWLRDGHIDRHRCSSELTNDELLKRFGLDHSRATVAIWPDGRPDLRHVIHHPTT